MRELDTWIAANVFGLKQTSVLNMNEGTFYKHTEYGPMIYDDNKFRLLNRFNPSESPADAMGVLKKCVERVNNKPSLVLIVDQDKKGQWLVYIYDAAVKKSHNCADANTLEIAICLFAKELFSKKCK
jgi:hypothetical protein